MEISVTYCCNGGYCEVQSSCVHSPHVHQSQIAGFSYPCALSLKLINDKYIIFKLTRDGCLYVLLLDREWNDPEARQNVSNDNEDETKEDQSFKPKPNLEDFIQVCKKFRPLLHNFKDTQQLG